MFIYLSVNLILCPPNSAARNYRKILKSVRDGTFEYDSEEPVTTDWAQYYQAHIYEMIYYPDNIRDLVDGVDEWIKKRTYHRKRGSCSETVNSMVKCWFGADLQVHELCPRAVPQKTF